MRVTENTNYNAVRNTIERSKSRMETLQNQASTLRKLSTPSEDPAGAAKVLEIRTDKVNNEQFISNAQLAEAYLSNSDHVVSELADIVVRAKELALGQSNGTNANDESRWGVAEEVTQLFKNAVALANTRVGERYIFGGHRTTTPPVDTEGKYLGDDNQIMIEVAKGVYMASNLPGSEVFNSRPEEITRQKSYPPEVSNRAPASANQEAEEEGGPKPGNNINVFQELLALRIGLLTGDRTAIQSTLERFDDLHSRLVSVRSKIGARLMGLQNTSQTLERQTLTNAALGSQIEDADMARVMSDLAKEETVFRSALQSSKNLITPTLLDFLR